MLKRLNELRGEGGGGAPSQATAPVAQTAPAKAIPHTAGQVSVPPATAAPAVSATAVDLDPLWRNLLEAIARVSRFAHSYFIQAHPVSFVKNVLTIGFDPEFADQIAMVENAKNHTLVATKLAELGRPNVQVKIIQAERPESFAPPAPAVVEEAPPVAAPPPAPAAAVSNSQPGPARTAAPAKGPAQLDPSEFKNDPLIKKALEVFKGTIVEVRG